ncbi:MAG: hypothetical protein ABS888_00120 [Eubacteriales bacterium]
MPETVLGKYRNLLGVELEITGYEAGPHILGTVLRGEIKDQLFGTRHVFVEPAFLAEVYRKVETP